MRIRIRSDPLIFELPDPDLLLFSMDPTCNNGYIKICSGKFLNKSETSYWWTAVTSKYFLSLKYINIYFSFRIKVGSGSGSGSDFSAEPDPETKISDPHLWLYRILIWPPDIRPIILQYTG